MMSKKEIAYFEAAKAVSTLSDHRYQMGCIVVNKHKIISSGYNSETRCHGVQARLNHQQYGMFSPGKIHAEISALLPLRRTDLSKASIFIYRETRDGKKALARPCPCCEKFIKELGIKNIYYTGNDSLVYEEFI